MSRCPHCPCTIGVLCKSREHARFCELADPSHPWSHVWRPYIAAKSAGQDVAIADFMPPSTETRPTPQETPLMNEPAPVGLLTRAANFAKATVQHVAAGMPEASPEETARRLAICRGCENYRTSDGTCGGTQGCGCFVEIKAKWLDQHCPVGKW